MTYGQPALCRRAHCKEPALNLADDVDSEFCFEHATENRDARALLPRDKEGRLVKKQPPKFRIRASL